jgi:translocator protein
MGIFKVKNKRSMLTLVLIILFTDAVGALSGYLGMSDPESYNSLIKPVFAPPPWVYIIVWPILYFFMSFAVYRICMLGKQGEYINKAIKLYLFQLLLNFIWTIIFFRFRLIGLAFIELMLLLVFVLLTTFEFFRLNKLAGLIMIPYILWVSFAGVLNYAFWMLNNM